MREEQDRDLIWANSPIPAARSLEHFSATKVADGETVLFDNERLTYHTLNAPALAVWQLCDGTRTSVDLSESLSKMGNSLSVDVIELAAAQLLDAGLLNEQAIPNENHQCGRRELLKLAAAGVMGAAFLPVITSISAPVAANATTCTPGSNLGLLAPCACSGECAIIPPGTTRCCCNTPGTGGVCATGPIGCGLLGAVCMST